MKLKRVGIIFLIIISLTLLSGCELYDQLYGEEVMNDTDDGVTFIDMKDIKVDEPDEDLELFPSDDEVIESDEEVMESEIVQEGDAIVVLAEETELISLEPDAADPDADELQFFYTEPLDDSGNWQTTYGDEGEYTVSITASDGTLSATQDVLIIVNKKEETPTIDEMMPLGSVVETEEDSILEFRIESSDLNDDPLTYEWKLDGEMISTGTSFVYEINFDAAGSHTMKVEVTDGISVTTQLWSITVANINRLPELEDIIDIEVDETDTIMIIPIASDPDGDLLTYTISEPVGDDGEWETGYDDAGIYLIKVVASDGEDSVSTDVNVKVNNVNRAPVITGIVRK